MSPAIPTDTRPLIDRLREAVPGLEWEKSGSAVVGRGASCDLVSANSSRRLLCWVNNSGETLAIDIPCPSDDEVVRIVKDWYAKTHPAKSVTERTKELIREAVPGVEIREERGRAETRLVCMVPPGTAPFVGTIPDEMTIAELERNKGVVVDAVRKALVKPTNTIPSWAQTARDRLSTVTSDSWLAECVDGFWQVSSAKNGQKLVATVVDGFFRLEVHEGSAVLPYRKLMLPELLELAKTLCKARNDLDIPEQAVRFAREMRDAGFEVETKQASTNESVHITVRSKATGKESRLHYGTLVGWTCDGVPNLTIAQANSRARLALTKQPTIEELREALAGELRRLGERPTLEDAMSESGQPDKHLVIRKDGAMWGISNEALAMHQLSELPALAKRHSELLTKDAAEHKKKQEKAAENNKHRAILEKLRKAVPVFFWRFTERDSYVAHDSAGMARATIIPASGAWDFVRTLADNSTAFTSVASPEEALPLVEEWARKISSAEHEAFERKAREATTQYLKDAGMAVTKVTPTMTANAMVDLLASQGVEATIETIDDHIAVCVTDPSTGEVHKAICDPAGNWLMDGEEVYGLVAATELRELGQRQKKEKAMGKSTRRQRIEQGIYLGAAKSATDKARDGVVALLVSGLPAEEQAGARAVLAKILETEIGAGAFGFVMGEAVDLAAGQFEGESPKVEAFAEALQVVGAMRGANTVIDALFEPITSAISGMIAAIPEPPKVRATPDAPAEEHEEPAHTGRKARAAR